MGESSVVMIPTIGARAARLDEATPSAAGPLTLRERFAYEAKSSFSPISLVTPAVSATLTMAR